MESVEGERMQLGDRPKVRKALFQVPWIKVGVRIDTVRPESEVSGVVQNARAIRIDQPFEESRIPLATIEQRSLRFTVYLP